MHRQGRNSFELDLRAKRMGRRATAGAVSLLLSASALVTIGASSASASHGCHLVTAANNYETRSDGVRTYWFPNSTWRKNPWGCRNTELGRIGGPIGYARGYYRRGNGNWGFASQPGVRTTETSNRRYELIYDLLPNTRFNHGHSTLIYSTNYF